MVGNETQRKSKSIFSNYDTSEQLSPSFHLSWQKITSMVFPLRIKSNFLLNDKKFARKKRNLDQCTVDLERWRCQILLYDPLNRFSNVHSLNWHEIWGLAYHPDDVPPLGLCLHACQARLLQLAHLTRLLHTQKMSNFILSIFIDKYCI